MRNAARIAALILAALAAADARAESLDPTPETTPPIELDGSVGIGGDVPFEPTTATWTIDDDLGSYSDDRNSLFHSFGRFDVPLGHTADFIATRGTPQTVFARVTWNEPSDIEGTLHSRIAGPEGVPADFYLINPAGVRLGRGARLDVLGSFHLTTAGHIGFEDGARFAASASEAAPLFTTLPPSSYGFLSERAASIEVGVNQDILSNALSVPAGKTLALVAGDVEVFNGGRTLFSAPGARLALVAAGRGVEVPIDLASFDPRNVSSEIPLGRVEVAGTGIEASFPAGSLLVRAGSFELTSSSVGVFHDGSQPVVFDKAVDVSVRGGLDIAAASVAAATYSGEPAGGISLASDGQITVSAGSSVLGGTAGTGAGSEVLVRASSLRVSGGGQIVSQSGGAGPGGAIDIGVGALTLEATSDPSDPSGRTVLGGVILSTSESLSEPAVAGPGGPIRVVASTLDASDAGFSPSGTLIASKTIGATGAPAGSVEIDADAISLRDGAQIFSSTSGTGNAGAVRVRADSIEVEGIEFDASAELNRPALIETRALPGSSGHAGELQPDGSVLGVSIETGTLEVSNGGEIGTATEDLGRAGDLVVRARERVLLDGGAFGLATLQSRATAALEDPSVGPGGLVKVTTPELELRDGGQITSATNGTGNAGRVELHPGTLRVSGRAGENRSRISAQTLAQGLTGAGNAGGVEITSSDEVTLRDVTLLDGARISVETGNDQPAGNIVIDAEGRVALDAAAISAQATRQSNADGGSITITADGGIYLDNGAIIEARALGSGDAGRVVLDGGQGFELTDSFISTESAEGGGGVIEISADERILLTDSRIDTSVANGEGGGGDVRIDPELMVLNRSEIRADAFLGDGGRIFIRADQFVRSQTSVLSASSRGPGDGVDGEIVITSPEAQLTSERAEPAQEYLDVAALLRTSCGAAAGSASFVVARVAGLPASPEGPLPAPLWDALAQVGAPGARATPISTTHASRPLRAGALAGGCEAGEEL